MVPSSDVPIVRLSPRSLGAEDGAAAKPSRFAEDVETVVVNLLEYNAGMAEMTRTLTDWWLDQNWDAGVKTTQSDWSGSAPVGKKHVVHDLTLFDPTDYYFDGGATDDILLQKVEQPRTLSRPAPEQACKAEFGTGSLVDVIRSFKGDSASSYTRVLQVGERGTVQQIDEKGNAYITFDSGNQWVFQQRLQNLRVVSKEVCFKTDSIASDSTSASKGAATVVLMGGLREVDRRGLLEEPSEVRDEESPWSFDWSNSRRGLLEEPSEVRDEESPWSFDWSLDWGAMTKLAFRCSGMAR